MASKTVDIAGIGQVLVRKNRRSKSVRLTISHDGQVRITQPSWLPYRAGIEFARTKTSWINQRIMTPIIVHEQDVIGKSHTVIVKTTSSTRLRSRVSDTEIILYLPGSIELTSPEAQSVLQNACHKALKAQAEKLLPSRVKVLADSYGFTATKVQIKKLKSRWGSCNDRQEIVLNFYLMQLPWDYIDYVILHELTHTKIMSHNNQFWSELTHVLPEASFFRKAIKNYRPTLIPASNNKTNTEPVI